ncbi:hypothetical protein Anas_03884, partial [Armadillidium nasatum]
FLLGSDEAGKLDVSNAFERIQKQGLNEEIVGGVTSSIVDGIVGDMTGDPNLQDQQTKMASNVASSVLKGFISGEDKNILDQVKSSGVSDDDIAKIASNVVQGVMTSDPAEGSNSSSELKKNEGIAQKLTIAVVKGLL